MDDSFPSFEELDRRHFPMAALDSHNLVPISVTESSCSPPINFFKGGIILAMAIHHSCSDGPGCDGLLTTWAESSAASEAAELLEPIDEAIHDRSHLSAPKPDAARWKELDGMFPVLKNLGGPLHPRQLTSRCRLSTVESGTFRSPVPRP